MRTRKGTDVNYIAGTVPESYNTVKVRGLKSGCPTERNFQKSRFLTETSATVTQEVNKVFDIEVNVTV